MAVKIRLARMGRRHSPFFRIHAIESRNPRDGKILEKLGHYDPIEKDPDKQLVLNVERAKYWLEQGAVPSETVSEMLLKLGIDHKQAQERAARRAKARSIAKAKGKLFDKTQKIEVQKKAEAAKAAEEKAKTEAEQAQAAEEKAKAEAEKTEAVKAEATEEQPPATEEQTDTEASEESSDA
jgi:small subunit ribosomal protein S16